MQSVKTVLKISKVCVKTGVPVGNIIAVKVSNNGQIWRVGDPQVATMPRHSLDAVKTRRKDVTLVIDTVVVAVGENVHTVTRRLRPGTPVLRAHPNAHPAMSVKDHRTRIANQRFSGNQRDPEPIWNSGHIFAAEDNGRNHHRHQQHCQFPHRTCHRTRRRFLNWI